MTNVGMFKAYLHAFGERQSDIAKALNISETTLSFKIHGKDGAQFSQKEIDFLRSHWCLTSDELVGLMFDE